jgi:hypothetical protein
VKYATKINMSFDGIDVQKRARLALAQGFQKGSGLPVSHEYRVHLKELQEIKDRLPPSLRNKQIIVRKLYIHDAGIPAHIHLRDMCVINHHVHANQEETIFYEGEVQRDNDVVTDNDDPFYFMVNTRLLTEVEKYTAKTGDTWILDTVAPHAVIPTKPISQDRELLQIYFYDATYEEVVRAFNPRAIALRFENLPKISEEILSLIPHQSYDGFTFEPFSPESFESAVTLWSELKRFGVEKQHVDKLWIVSMVDDLMIHRDTTSAARMAINIPVLGCEGTELVFYEPRNGVESTPVEYYPGAEAYHPYSIRDVKPVERISYFNHAVLWDVTNIHSVIGVEGQKRITLSVRLKNDDCVKHL